MILLIRFIHLSSPFTGSGKLPCGRGVPYVQRKPGVRHLRGHAQLYKEVRHDDDDGSGFGSSSSSTSRRRSRHVVDT